eukprot:CAMPEP_0171325274 /NCGR_PEP_ID=MMETSP0816-20121228/116711_1 /TAXON_ID=420281 /ORGANISM="Proboscia inermis, Strain CCAP1064/1" /LENGTH=285 /DNA_ID=CAMNT_0011824419 /DNA_START=292 /DNA_END=1149 /DNA_ORIENTATION=+
MLAAQYALGGNPEAAEISPEGKRLSDALHRRDNPRTRTPRCEIGSNIRSDNTMGPPSGGGSGRVGFNPLHGHLLSDRITQWALRAVAVAVGWGLTLSMATYCLFGSAMVGYNQSALSINFSIAAAITVVTQLVLFPKLIAKLGEHLVCALGLTLSGSGLLAFSLLRVNPIHRIVYLLSRVGNALGDTACATLVARSSDGSEARARNLGAIYSVRAGARIVTPLLGAWMFELSRNAAGRFPGVLPYAAASLLTAVLIPVPLALKSFEDRKSRQARAGKEIMDKRNV